MGIEATTALSPLPLQSPGPSAGNLVPVSCGLFQGAYLVPAITEDEDRVLQDVVGLMLGASDRVNQVCTNTFTAGNIEFAHFLIPGILRLPAGSDNSLHRPSPGPAWLVSSPPGPAPHRAPERCDAGPGHRIASRAV